MKEPKLVLKGEMHNKSLHFNDTNAPWCVYYKQGTMSEDGYVSTIFDEPETFDLKESSHLDDLDIIDLDFLLDFFVLTLDDTKTYIFQYTSRKFFNVEEINPSTFEIPLESIHYFTNEDILDILFYHSDDITFPSDMYDFPYGINEFIKYFSDLKTAVYKSSILENPQYQPFADAFLKFMKEYNIELDSSKETEMTAATVFIVRKYFNTDWKTIYRHINQ